MSNPTSEWDYRYSERLGLMCGDKFPTKAQEAIAREEAFLAVDAIEKQTRPAMITDDSPCP